MRRAGGWTPARWLCALVAAVWMTGCAGGGEPEQPRPVMDTQGRELAPGTPGRALNPSGRKLLAMGLSHSLAVRADGTVWSWGENVRGQLGVEGQGRRPTPVQVPSLTKVKAVGAGHYFSLALRTDGSVWAWGGNINGPGSQPMAVPGLADVVDIAAGGNHALALRDDGTAWAWGYNFNGQLGDGTRVNRSRAVAVVGLADVVAVTAGESHSLALRADGTVWAVTAGESHSLALRADGTVWAWGSNFSGQLGDGTRTHRSQAAAVAGLADVVAIAAGASHSLALRADGTVWAWGYHFPAGLVLTPVQVVGLTDVVAVMSNSALRADGTLWRWGTSASPHPSRVGGLEHVMAATNSLALLRDGTLWAWGANSQGQLGTGTDLSFTPVRVPGVTGAASVSSGHQFSLVVRQDGTVWSWGVNTEGQLGYEPFSNEARLAAPVPGLSEVVEAVAGSNHALARRRDGTVWSWGSNAEWQLGEEDTMYQRPRAAPVPGLTGVKALATGATHSVALRDDGTVWAWGGNGNGQLGDSTMMPRAQPAPVQGLSDVVAIASRDEFSLAVRADGTVWAWGGPLSFPVTPEVEPAPMQVPGLSDVVAVAMGGSHVLALRADGSVWTWRRELLHQLPFGWIDPSLLPVPVAGLPEVVAITSLGNASAVLAADGTVWTWGDNGEGQLGYPTLDLVNPVPTRVVGLTEVVSLEAGEAQVVAVRADGTVWSWGSNQFGVLGLGYSHLHPTPARVRMPCRFTAMPSLEHRQSGPLPCVDEP